MTFTVLLAADIGARLGVSAQFVRDHWQEWARESGFPKPLPIGKRCKWDAEAFEIWLDSRRPAELRQRTLPVRPANEDQDPAMIVAARLAARRSPGGRLTGEC